MKRRREHVKNLGGQLVGTYRISVLRGLDHWFKTLHAADVLFGLLNVSRVLGVESSLLELTVTFF